MSLMTCSDNREILRLRTEVEGLKGDLAFLTSQLNERETKTLQFESDLTESQTKERKYEEKIRQLEATLASREAYVSELATYLEKLLNKSLYECLSQTFELMCIFRDTTSFSLIFIILICITPSL